MQNRVRIRDIKDYGRKLIKLKAISEVRKSEAKT